jgi:hypothetical protein
MSAPPPSDLDDRAIGVARVIAQGVANDTYAGANYHPLASWARARCSADARRVGDDVIVRCEVASFVVEWRFNPDGLAAARFRWTFAAAEPAWFAPEFSLAAPLGCETPGSAELWRYPIETFTKSERGMDRIVQGESVTPLYDARAGEAVIEFVLSGGS